MTRVIPTRDSAEDRRPVHSPFRHQEVKMRVDPFAESPDGGDDTRNKLFPSVARLEASPIVLDTSSSPHLYFPMVFGWQNRHQEAYSPLICEVRGSSML